jgi:hypothetical protein
MLLIEAAMANPAGESRGEVLMLDFDRRLMLQLRGPGAPPMPVCPPTANATTRSNLTTISGEMLAAARTGRNGRHALAGGFWQSVFGCLAGYADVTGAERLRHDAAMRWTRVSYVGSEKFLSLTS